MTLPASGNATAGLGWIDRTACVYLFLPALLFCLWFVPMAAIVLAALAAFGAYHALKGKGTANQPLSQRMVLSILALALAWAAIAGVGHFFYANSDWVVRDGVLHDLATNPWPPAYESGATVLILRAPIGYYLPAAALGQLAGAGAAGTALYLWTALGWGLVLAAACTLFERRAQRIVCILILFAFGGMDLLGHVWGSRQLPAPGEHIEWWMPFVQYSSNTTLLFWVPNHALPAWLGTVLILRHWRRPELARITPLLAAAIPLWSPLAAIGLFPFFLFGLRWRTDARVLFSARTCLPFAPLAVAAALYLGLDATTIQHGWLLLLSPSPAAYLYRYVLFCLLEFGILALLLARIRSFDLPMRIAICVLCLLPLYFYGPGNDLAMRGSIPALTVLALATVRPLTQRPWTIWQTMLALVLLIGALGAAQEPLRAMIAPAWAPVQQTLPEAVGMTSPAGTDRYPPHYFARKEPRGVQRLMRQSRPILSTSGGPER